MQVYLVTGGYDTGYLSSTELLVHGASSWTSSGPLPSPRRYLRGAALNNKIVVTGANIDTGCRLVVYSPDLKLLFVILLHITSIV